MSNLSETFYTDGTSALVIDEAGFEKQIARIIPFEQRGESKRERRSSTSGHMVTFPSKQPSIIKGFLESSEMYCSLKHESFLGCPYDALSQQNVACIALGSALIGLISLILGS